MPYNFSGLSKPNFSGLTKSGFNFDGLSKVDSSFVGEIEPLPEADVSSFGPRAVGAIAGGVKAFEGAGFGGIAGVLGGPGPTPEDPYAEPTRGSLEQGVSNIEAMGGVASDIFLKTPAQQEGVKALMWPIEKLGEASRFVGDTVQKAVTGVGGTTEDPFAEEREGEGIPELGATVATAFEGMVFFYGMPKAMKWAKEVAKIAEKKGADAVYVFLKDKKVQDANEAYQASKKGVPLTEPDRTPARSTIPGKPETELHPADVPIRPLSTIEPKVLRPDQEALLKGRTRKKPLPPTEPSPLTKPDTTPVKSKRVPTVEERLGGRPKYNFEGLKKSTKPEIIEKAPEIAPVEAPKAKPKEPVARAGEKLEVDKSIETVYDTLKKEGRLGVAKENYENHKRYQNGLPANVRDHTPFKEWLEQGRILPPEEARKAATLSEAELRDIDSFDEATLLREKELSDHRRIVPPKKEPSPAVKVETKGAESTTLSFMGTQGIYESIKSSEIPRMFNELKEAYTSPPEVAEVKNIIGEYTGNIQIIDQKLTKMGKEINRTIPKDRQVAITNYMQAGGDKALLANRAANSKGQLKKGYQDAAKLTEAEIASAKDFRKQLDDIIQQAIDADVVDSYVENYVRGEWVRPDKAAKELISSVNSGYFTTKPREALQKVFQSYFDGEQAGFVPKDKRIGAQLVANIRSLSQAIEARKAILSLLESVEADGRKTVSVAGGLSMPREAIESATRKGTFIKAGKMSKDTAGYKDIDHPALRKWKFVSQDTAGKPIMLEGNMKIHPDAYSRVNALLGTSKIRSFTIPKKVPVVGGRKPGAAMLDAGAFIKSTILLGPFHQTHVGLHALFHKVNPFGVRELNFDTRPLLVEGVKKGLMLFNHNAVREFGEGLASGGLLHRVPKLGKQLTRYQEWLFQDYIPRLKGEMFENAVARATEHYKADLESGKLTRGQLIENAANQANAAFGEQNYKYMGRNPTIQDALRIVGLAPDFLEARFRFTGQALKPYGREQSAALLRGAIYMATTAQVVNLTIGDKKVHWDRPFSFFIGGREYAPRSVVGDIFHLIKDPRSFAYHRLNPLWGKPVVELITKRDASGRKGTYEELGKDILQSWIPIPAQGLAKKKMGDTPAESVVNALFQSTGLSNYAYRSDFERYAITRERPITISKAVSEKAKFKRGLADELRAKVPNAIKNIDAAIREGKLTRSDKVTIINNAKKHPVALITQSMSVDEIAKGIKKATAEEKRIILPIYGKKIVSGGISGKLTKVEIQKHIKILRDNKKKGR